MDSDHGQEQAHKRDTATPASQGLVGPLAEAPVAELQGAAPQALLSEPAIGARGNAPVRNAAVQRMQQTYGNKATRRFLQRTPAGAVPVQRDDTPSLPPVPNYQLTPPSLLQPQDPTARYHLGGDQHLHLDPQIEAMIDQHFGLQLDPGNVRGALASLQLGALPAAPAGSSSGTPLSGPGVPQPAPLVPAGAGPATPHAAGAGDIMSAVLAVPSIDQAVTRLKTQALDQVKTDWGRLRTGEKVATVSTIAVIGLGALGGAMTDPQARQFVFSQLNGRVLPVPKVDWLHVETNISGDNLMFGIHVDVGRLLPKELGFGPGSPGAIGGPPH